MRAPLLPACADAAPGECEARCGPEACRDAEALSAVAQRDCCEDPACDDGLPAPEACAAFRPPGAAVELDALALGAAAEAYCCKHRHLARYRLPAPRHVDVRTGAGRSFPFVRAGEPGPEPAAAAQDSAKESAQPVTSKFIVEGMCCSAEERLIGRLLEPLEGVREVELCATTRLALVRHDAAVLSPTTILQSLNGANMDAHLASVKAPGEEGLRARLPPWPVLVAAVLCAVSFVGYAPRPPASYFKWVAVGAIAFGLPPLAKKAWAGLRRGLVGIDLLMIVATVGALALQEPIDAGILVVLFNLAEWLEGKTLATARNSLGAVLALRPDEAEVLSGARPGPRPVEEVRVGDVVAVRPGDKVPVDGEVVKGRSTVDESSLTGEARGVAKAAGAQVFAGTVNQGSYLEVQVTAESGDSTVAKLAAMVEEAAMQRSPTENLVETVSR